MQDMRTYLSKFIQRKLVTLPAEELARQSQVANRWLIISPFYSSASVVCTYLPKEDSKHNYTQINTLPLIYDCLKKRKRCFIPVANYTPRSEVSMLEIEGVEDLETNFKMNPKSGMLEPLRSTIPFRHELFSSVFGIPIEDREKWMSDINLLEDKVLYANPQNILAIETGSFSLMGESLEKVGYYDKFLADLGKVVKTQQESSLTKAALCFDFQLLKFVPREKYHQFVDLVCTPSQIIECRNPKKIKE